MGVQMTHYLMVGMKLDYKTENKRLGDDGAYKAYCETPLPKPLTCVFDGMGSISSLGKFCARGESMMGLSLRTWMT